MRGMKSLTDDQLERLHDQVRALPAPRAGALRGRIDDLLCRVRTPEAYRVHMATFLQMCETPAGPRRLLALLRHDCRAGPFCYDEATLERVGQHVEAIARHVAALDMVLLTAPVERRPDAELARLEAEVRAGLAVLGVAID